MTTAEEKEIIKWASDGNLRHMRQNAEIHYLFECLFRRTDILVDGTTRAQVGAMTQFQKIGLLERLQVHPEMISHEILRDISGLVTEIKPHKDGFRTADDFEVSQ